MARRRATRLAFEALSIEGALLPADFLARVARLEAPRQMPKDYGIAKGLELRDEIARHWTIAQAHWAEFTADRRAGGSSPVFTMRFVEGLLREGFDFASLGKTAPYAADGRTFPLTFVARGGRASIAVTAHDRGLDEVDRMFGDAVRRRSAFGVVQEWLNATKEAQWGIATNGATLRLLRDNASLTRPAWIEADLQRIFAEERFADFSVLWLLIHESRFGTSDAPARDCPLEQWWEESRAAGTRAREQLRDGVEKALVALGEGFLADTTNAGLRHALQDGQLTREDLFAELLRLVYRLIFLLTVEDRGLLHPSDSAAAPRALYTDGYAARRLVERAVRRAAHDRHVDLWEGLKIVFRALARGEPRLALPALGGLFASDQCPHLDTARLENRHLLFAIFHLAWLRDDSGLARVAWRDMGPEELGSVYESLLELVPEIRDEGRSFGFAGADATGAARKLTGSYYTKDSLVQLLLDETVEPVVRDAIAAAKGPTVEAVLGLRIVDPACGSGHFLLAAARRLATHLARLEANGTPTAHEYRHALRRVVSRCVFGVDRNPMAVELCRAALWIETVEPGKPMSFLDAHVRCGDALLGVFDLTLLDGGIPQAAYDERDGDEKAVVKTLKSANRQRVQGAASLPLLAATAAPVGAVEALPEDTVDQVEAKRAALAVAEADAAVSAARLRADLFCAAFFARKTAATRDTVPVTADIDRVSAGQPPRPNAVALARALAARHRFFHWPVAFPEVFARGGFNVVLGNPPWETMSPDAKEWFAPYDPAVRELAPEDQKRRIAELLEAPGMQARWDNHCRALYDAAAFMKESGRFRLFAEGNLGKGDFNVWRMFTETALRAVRPGGVAAQFVPENLYNGANAAAIRDMLFRSFTLRLLAGFQNARNVWFPGVYYRAKFCIYVAAKSGSTSEFPAAFGINSEAKLATLRAGRRMVYPVELVREFSPDALAITEIAHPDDIAIVKKLYARFPKFGADAPGLAQRDYMREIDMGNDREDFTDHPDGVPLYEGRMVEAFDHRAKAWVSGRGRGAVWRELAFGSPDKRIAPQWRIAHADLPEKIGDRWRAYRVGFCDVASPTNQRSLVAALIPSGAICGDKVPTITFSRDADLLMLLWLGVANSLSMDFLARKKVSLKMSFTVLDSLPLPRDFQGTALDRQIAAGALRLTAAGPEMVPFWSRAAPALGLDADERPCEDPAKREGLRAELDVRIARDLFGLTREEMQYLLDPADVLGSDCGFETFGELKRAEKKQHDEFRTRRLILEMWDRLEPPGVAEPSRIFGKSA